MLERIGESVHSRDNRDGQQTETQMVFPIEPQLAEEMIQFCFKRGIAPSQFWNNALKRELAFQRLKENNPQNDSNSETGGIVKLPGHDKPPA